MELKQISSQLFKELGMDLDEITSKDFSFMKKETDQILGKEFLKGLKKSERKDLTQKKKFEAVAKMIENKEHLKDPKKFEQYLKRNKLKVEFS